MVERRFQDRVRTHAPKKRLGNQLLAHRVLAEALTAQGRFAEAEDQLRRALALASEAHVHALLVGQMLTRLADVLAAQGRHAEAEPLASKALGLARRYDNDMTYRDGTLALCWLAESRSALGRPDALEMAQKALDALRAWLQEQDPVRRETEPHLLRILGLDA